MNLIIVFARNCQNFLFNHFNMFHFCFIMVSFDTPANCSYLESLWYSFTNLKIIFISLTSMILETKTETFRFLIVHNHSQVCGKHSVQNIDIFFKIAKARQLIATFSMQVEILSYVLLEGDASWRDQCDPCNLFKIIQPKM